MSDIHKDDSGPSGDAGGDAGGEDGPKITKLLGDDGSTYSQEVAGLVWSCWQAPGPFGIATLAGEAVISLDC